MLVSNFANRLNEAIKIRHITPAEIVRRSEILFEEKKIFKPLTKPQMTNYLKGSYEAKQDNVYALSLILDVDEAWLMGCDVPMERKNDADTDKDLLKKIGAIPLSGENMVKIPILGTVKAGYNYLAEENIVGTIKVNMDLVKDGSEYFALKVKGDSMQPVLYEDDVVIIKRQNDCEDGQIAVVLINGDEGTIKKVKKSSNGIWLQPFNNNYEPLVFTNDEIENIPVKIIGVVKQLQREF
jgi:repressor LexA